MDDETGDRSRSGRPLNAGKPQHDGDQQTLSPRSIFVVLAMIAIACVGGYFLLMKLIDVSRQEDCLLAGRRNCAPIEVPANR